jgi:DNA-binding transcriptional LysR family regulator
VVRGGEITDQSLIARRIAELRFLTCAAPSYLARHGEPRHPAELERQHTVVGYFTATSGKPFPLEFKRGEEAEEINGRSILAVNDGNAYVAAGLAGLGIATAPRFMVAEHLASGALIPVLRDWSIDPIPLYVVYPPNRHLSTRLRIFVDWVAELFGRELDGARVAAAS